MVGFVFIDGSGNGICDACSGERMILGPKKPDSVPQRVCDRCVRELKKTQDENTQKMTGSSHKPPTTTACIHSFIQRCVSMALHCIVMN